MQCKGGKESISVSGDVTYNGKKIIRISVLVYYLSMLCSQESGDGMISWRFHQKYQEFMLQIQDSFSQLYYPGALCSQGFFTPLYFILGLYALKVPPHHYTLSWGFMLSRFLLTTTLYPGALCSQGSFSHHT